MTCNPKHFTYQTEKQRRSPQAPLPTPPAIVRVPGITVAELELAIDPAAVGGDYSIVTMRAFK